MKNADLLPRQSDNSQATAATDDGSQGSQRIDDTAAALLNLRNWQPGDDDSEELLLQKIQDALRDGKSERALAKLLNVPRSVLWRGKKFSAIPATLFERLLQANVGSRATTYIGRYFETGELPKVEAEYCPHCGHCLRVRSAGIRRAIDVLNQWIEEGRPEAPAAESDEPPEAVS